MTSNIRYVEETKKWHWEVTTKDTFVQGITDTLNGAFRMIWASVPRELRYVQEN